MGGGEGGGGARNMCVGVGGGGGGRGVHEMCACEKFFSATLAFKPTTRFGDLGHNDTIITIGINKHEVVEKLISLCGHCC